MSVTRRRAWAVLMAFLLGCRAKGQKSSVRTTRADMLKQVKALIAKDRQTPHLPACGRHLPEHLLNGSYTLIAGVWVEDRLYYEALGIPIGTPPPGNDVKDRMPGIPESTLGECERCKRSWKWVEGHTTPYGQGESPEGIFALCATCWNGIAPEERLPYYRALFERNAKMLLTGKHVSMEEFQKYVDTWPLLKAAVLGGK